MGWIEALRLSLAPREDLELGIACISDVPFEPFQKDGVTYYPLYSSATSTRVRRLALRVIHRDRSLDYTRQSLAAVEAFCPDLIHVHGTETTMGLIVGQVATPSLVSLQGQVRDYAEHFFDGLSIGEIARDTIRPQSVVRGVGLVPTYLSFRKSIASEERILESAHYFTGRTHFDREAAARVNPDAKYFHCDRVLRSEFYEPIQELRPQGSPVVYATGSSAPRKGIGLLLDAVADVVRKGHSDVKLRVSGSIEGSPMWPMLQKRVARLGLEGRVEWLGPLDAASVRRELLACTVFVHPAWMDNSPNALAEAMMCETACIASTAGGIPSMVRSGEDGLLFECGNAEDLSSALQRLLDDEGLRARLGAAAKRTADQRHDPALIAAVTMDTYATILSDIAEQ